MKQEETEDLVEHTSRELGVKEQLDVHTENREFHWSLWVLVLSLWILVSSNLMATTRMNILYNSLHAFIKGDLEKGKLDTDTWIYANASKEKKA